MDVNNLSVLYEEMLLISPGLVTATGISKVMDNEVSHDKITRLLSSGIFLEKYIWQKAKPLSLLALVRNECLLNSQYLLISFESALEVNDKVNSAFIIQ